MPDDVLKLSVEATADEAKTALNETVDSIGALVARVQGSEGDLKKFENLLRENASTGLDLARSLQLIGEMAGPSYQGVAQLAKSLIDQGVASQTAAQQSGELGSVFDGLTASINAEIDAIQSSATGAKDLGSVFDSLAQSMTQANAVANATTAQVQEVADSGEGFRKFAEGVKDWIEHPFIMAGEAAEKFILSMGPVGTVALAVAGGLAEIGKQIFELVNEEGAAVRQTQNFANMLGLGYEETKKLGLMARIVDTDIGGLARASFRLADALENPTGKAGMELQKLGITATESGEAILQVLQKLAEMPNRTERLAAAHILLGRASYQLAPLIENYDRLRESVDSLSNHLSNEGVQGLLHAREQINSLSVAWAELKEKMAAGFAAPVNIIIKAINQVVSGNPKDVDQPIEQRIAKIRAALNEKPKGFQGPTQGVPGGDFAYNPQFTETLRKQLRALEDQQAVQRQSAEYNKSLDDGYAASALARKAENAKTLEGMKAELAVQKELEKTSRAKYLSPVGPDEYNEAGEAMRKAAEEVKRLEAAIKAAEVKPNPGKDMSQWAAVEEKKVQNQRRLGLEMVKAADDQAHQLLKTHDITQSQLTERLLAAEDARYAIEVTAATRMDDLKKKVALAEKKPVPVPDKAPEVLKADHENRQQKIRDTGADAAMKQDDEIAKARIQNTEKVAMAQVAAETQAARSAFAAQKSTLEQETEALQSEATKRYAIEVDAANGLMVLAKARGKDGEKEVLDLTAKIETLYIAHEAELTKIAADGENKRKQATEATEMARIKGALDSGTKTVELQQQRVDFEAKLGLITNKQKLASERDLDSQLDALQRTAIERELALLDVKDVNYAKKEQDLQNKLAGLRAQAALRQQKEMEDSLTHTAAIYTKILGGIGTAFQTSVDAVIRGTQTIGGAIATMGRNVLLTWTNDLVQMGVKWAQFELLRLVVSKATAASITGVKIAAEGIVTSATAAARAKDALGEGAVAIAAKAAAASIIATKLGANAATAVDGGITRTAEVLGLAAVAAAAAFASIAAIPVTGPGLAPAAAALAYTKVMAFAPAAAAEQGWDLPGSGGPFPTLLHKKEMVLPEEHADTIRKLRGSGDSQQTGNAAAQQSSKQVHAHYHAAPGETPDSIRKNSATFKQMIKDMARRGELRYA